MNHLQLLGALEIGLIYSLVAIAVFITFKIIDFPDLTVDGSFALGAAITVTLVTKGYNPCLATIVAILGGASAGAITGYLHVKLHILGLMAGILTMTGLYSINLRIMGSPNISIMDNLTIFRSQSVSIITFVIIIFFILLLIKLFTTEFGLAIRAIGINPKVSTFYGINVGLMKIVALSISNGIVALSGSLFSQAQGYADISMGATTIIVALASVVIGSAIFPPKKIWIGFVTCIFGSIIYRIAIACALQASDIGLEATDLNLITALLVIFTMRLQKLQS